MCKRSSLHGYFPQESGVSSVLNVFSVVHTVFMYMFLFLESPRNYDSSSSSTSSRDSPSIHVQNKEISHPV